MFSEDDLLPISALQHLLFCERQCALIHIERLWAENRLTIEGRHLHEKAHAAKPENRGDCRIARGLPVRSLRLGLFGVADVVEFHASPDGGVRMAFPIEYKRGRPKRNDADRVQLCAQALCLEETLDLSVSQGAIFYGKVRRRTEVSLDTSLRRTTETAAARLHELMRAGVTPRAKREPKCQRCSLLNLCMPDAADPSRSASRYLARALAIVASGTPPSSDAEL